MAAVNPISNVPGASAANPVVGAVNNIPGVISAGGVQSNANGAAIPDSVKTAISIVPQDYKIAVDTLTAYSQGQGRGQGAGTKDAATGKWSRGLVQSTQKHLGHGSLFTVYSGHDKQPDTFATLNLQVRVSLPNGGQQTYTLTQLAKGAAPNAQSPAPSQFEGVLKFYISDADLQGMLDKAAPGLKLEDVAKSGQFAIDASWTAPAGGWSHQWGGFGRDGMFPFALKAGGPVEQQTRVVVGLAGAQKVELDVSVPVGSAVKKKFPMWDTPKAAFFSHMELEGKARVPLTRFKEILERASKSVSDSPAEAAAAAQARQAMFGAEAPNWEGERVKKYDPKGVAMVADRHGLLPVNQFVDVYLDNAARDLAKNYICLRIRKVAGEKNNFTQVNYKPGPGIRDPLTNGANRIETELIVGEEVAQKPRLLLQLFNDAQEPLNPHNIGNAYLRRSTGRAVPASVPGDATSEITQFAAIGSNRRYKFQFHDKRTLVAFEASFDLCATLCLDARGLPLRVNAQGKADPNGPYFAMSVFGQMEPEANHMAGAVGGGHAAPAPQAGAAGPGGVIGPPTIHIHGLDDLSSPVFKTDPGYAQFTRVMPSFQNHLFGGPVGARDGAYPTDQKNAIGQRLAGIIPMNPQEAQLYAQELEATKQFREKASGSLVAAVQKAEAHIANARANYGRLPNGGPQIEKAEAEARDMVWEAFGQLNPLDFVDLAGLPKA